MIVNFAVQNFGTIKDKVTLSFEATNSKELEGYYVIEPIKGLRLLKFALIYGPNASGKSTLLKALDFLRNLVNPLSQKNQTFAFSPFLFDEKTIKENTFFSIEFIQYQVKYLYEVELNEKAIVAEKLSFFQPNKALVYERKTDLDKQLSIIQFGSKLKVNKEHKDVLEANTIWNNTVLGAYAKTNFESKELQAVIDWFNYTLQGVIIPKTDLLPYISEKLENEEINKINLLKVLQKADFNISDISIKKTEIQIDDNLFDFLTKSSDKEVNRKYESKEVIFRQDFGNDSQKQSFQLSYNHQSDGTKRYYQLSGLLLLMIQKGTIFPIDEIESSLHADLLKHFLLTFLVNSKDSQLIATTHHRELLMEKDIFRHDVIWFTEKKTDGGTELYSLSDFNTSVIRDTSSIYNAYKIGKLGAVPNVGDYYLDLAENGKK